MLEQRKIDKWAKVGLLEGLTGDDKEACAQLLENQALTVLRRREFAELNEETDHQKYVTHLLGAMSFPIVRRVFDRLTDWQKSHIMNMPAVAFTEPGEDEKLYVCVAADQKFVFDVCLRKELSQKEDSLTGDRFAQINREAELCQQLGEELGDHFVKQGKIALYVVLCDDWADDFAGRDDSVIISRYARMKND